MKNLSNKRKIAVSASAAVAAVGSIVAPLAMAATSCTNAYNFVNNNQIDKEYGVSKETYDDLKNQFRLAYRQKLEKQLYSGIELQKRLDGLEDELLKFDEASSSGNFGYTATTNALIDFARTQKQKYPTVTKSSNGVTSQETEAYGIQLVRHTRTKWSDLNDLYTGMADSFKTYMHNNKMPASTINKIMAESKAKFDDLTKQLKATYGNDALAGLLKAKEQIITLFDLVNEEVALISATIRLKDFMSEFVFEYTKYNQKGEYYSRNRLDNLLQNKDFAVGKILTDDLMNEIFTITRKSTGKVVAFNANTIVPGYIVKPKLTNISQNDFTNTHTISIDFGLVKNVYEQKYANDPEKLAMVTGHNFQVDDYAGNIEFDDNSSIANVLQVAKIQSREFIVFLTPQEEAKRLEETYFNKDSKKGNIQFQWDKDNQAYEAFFDNARQDKNNPGKWTGTISTQSLANAGLMISDGVSKFQSILKINDDVDDNIKNITFTSLFLQNCTITSNVIIDETDTSNRIVNHDFKIVYSNTIYNSNDALYDLKEISNLRVCKNFNVSNNFYDKINNKFNKVAKFVLCFNSSLKEGKDDSNGEPTPSDLNKLANDALLSLIFRSLVLASNFVFMTTTCCSVVKPWKDGKSKAICVLAIILSVAIFAYQTYDYYYFETNYFERVNNYKASVEKSQEEIINSILLKMLKQDLENNFILINDDGTYDKIKYAQQKAKFQNNYMSDMLNIYRNYSTINQYVEGANNTKAQIAMKQFNTILNDYGAEPSEYDKIKKDWQPLKGLMWWHSFVSSIIIMFGNMGLTYVLHKWVKKKPIAKDPLEDSMVILGDKSVDDSIDLERRKSVFDNFKNVFDAKFNINDSDNLTRWVMTDESFNLNLKLKTFVNDVNDAYKETVNYIRTCQGGEGTTLSEAIIGKKYFYKTLGIDDFMFADIENPSSSVLEHFKNFIDFVFN